MFYLIGMLPEAEGHGEDIHQAAKLLMSFWREALRRRPVHS